MRIRLSTIPLLVVCAAILLGWYVDRTRLATNNQELNAECAELFRLQTEEVDLSANPWPLNMTERPSRILMYDADDPEDRARYKRNEPSKLFGK